MNGEVLRKWEEPHKASVHWHESLQSWWVRIEPGVTGYESAEVQQLLKGKEENGWCACAGTPGSWDQLVIPPSEMERLRDVLRLIPIKAVVAALVVLLATSVMARADCLPQAPLASAFLPVAPPGGVIAQVLRVVVAWSDVRTERSYRVERSWWDGVAWRPWETLATLPRNSTTYTDWQPAQRARYRVVAVNGCGEKVSGESLVTFP